MSAFPIIPGYEVEDKAVGDMKTFSNLHQAVCFIAATVASGDNGSLAEACREALPPDWILARLREQNTATPLVGLYAGLEFPQGAHDFKLGGHDRELGHIHIDFVRSGDGCWMIQRIWMCR